MASVSAEAPADQAAIAIHLKDLPQHVLAAIAALLGQRDRAALGSCSRELAAASEGWWQTVEVSDLSSQASADSLGEWLRRRRPAVASLRLRLLPRDPCSRRAIELQLPEDPPREKVLVDAVCFLLLGCCGPPCRCRLAPPTLPGTRCSLCPPALAPHRLRPQCRFESCATTSQWHRRTWYRRCCSAARRGWQCFRWLSAACATSRLP